MITEEEALLIFIGRNTQCPREVLEGGKRGGGSGTQKIVYQKRPDGKFRFLSRWSLWSGGGGGVHPPPPTVDGYSNTPLPMPRGVYVHSPHQRRHDTHAETHASPQKFRRKHGHNHKTKTKRAQAQTQAQAQAQAQTKARTASLAQVRAARETNPRPGHNMSAPCRSQQNGTLTTAAVGARGKRAQASAHPQHIPKQFCSALVHFALAIQKGDLGAVELLGCGEGPTAAPNRTGQISRRTPDNVPLPLPYPSSPSPASRPHFVVSVSGVPLLHEAQCPGMYWKRGGIRLFKSWTLARLRGLGG